MECIGTHTDRLIGPPVFFSIPDLDMRPSFFLFYEYLCKNSGEKCIQNLQANQEILVTRNGQYVYTVYYDVCSILEDTVN
jgi:hypothetical protein